MSTVFGEVPSGAANGTNKVFTTANTFLTGSTRVYVNGDRSQLNVAYTESGGNTITFVTAPANAAVVLVDYDVYGGSGGSNTWTVNPNGSVDFNGSVHFPAGNDTASGMGVVVLGPGGGTASFPAVSTGLPGQPIVIDSSSAVPLAYTAAPTIQFNQLSPGGAGVAAHYSVTAGIPAGTPGSAAPFTLASATDLSGTAAAKNIVVVTGTGPTAFAYQVPKVGNWYSVTGIPATSSSTQAQRLLTSILVPAQAWAWVPEVFARCVVNGAVDTSVDLVARVGDPAAGDVCAYCEGQTGAQPPTLVAIPSFGSAMPGSSGYISGSTGYAQVPAGQAATIYLRAENQTGSSNPWSTGKAALALRVTPAP